MRIRAGDEHKTAFRMHLGMFICVYLDDILVLSRLHEEHMEHLLTVPTLLHANKLFIKASKCKFTRTSITFLGFVGTLHGITMDP